MGEDQTEVAESLELDSTPPLVETAETPVSEEPPAGRRRRRRLISAVVAVIGIVIIVLLATFGPFHTPSSRNLQTPTSGEPVPSYTFDAARAPAQSVVTIYHGGGWRMVGAFGVAISTPVEITQPEIADGFGFNSCSLTFALDAPKSLSVPAVASVASGNDSLWLFVFAQAGNSSLVLVGEFDGTDSIWGTFSGGPGGGSGCLGTVGAAPDAVPATELDSPAAMNAADAAGGSAFLGNHTNVTAVAYLMGAVYSPSGLVAPASWIVIYSPCPVSSVGGTTRVSEFLASLNATSGSVGQASVDPAGCYGPVA